MCVNPEPCSKNGPPASRSSGSQPNMAVGRRMAHILYLCTVLRGFRLELRGTRCLSGGADCHWSCSQHRQLPVSVLATSQPAHTPISSTSVDPTWPFQVLSSNRHCFHPSTLHYCSCCSPPCPVRARPGDLSPVRLLRGGVAPQTLTQRLEMSSIPSLAPRTKMQRDPRRRRRVGLRDRRHQSLLACQRPPPRGPLVLLCRRLPVTILGLRPRRSRACFLLCTCPSRLCWGPPQILRRHRLLPWSTQQPCRPYCGWPHLVGIFGRYRASQPRLCGGNHGPDGSGARPRRVDACDRSGQNLSQVLLAHKASAGLSDGVPSCVTA